MKTPFRLPLVFAASCALFFSAVRAADPVPPAVELWPAGAPGATGTSDEDKPAIYPLPAPTAQNTGAAILICPGGGFLTRTTDYEGTLIARWLNTKGISGYVLRYRIRPLYDVNSSLLDAQRAVQFLRAHAEEYHLDPNRIGMMGFSAGAELSSMAALRALAPEPDAADPVARFSSRPNFAVLVYGSANPRNYPVDNSSPPTFMFCTAEDTGHITGMVTLYSALLSAHVPVEAHFFTNGEHGVGLAPGDPVLGPWSTMLYNWIRTEGFLTDKPRVGLHGVVQLDDAPLTRGYVVFTPIGLPGAPPITAYVTNVGQVRGAYTVHAKNGLVPGRYHVEVRLEANRWLSTGVDPVIVAMNQKQRAGTMTDADREQWNAYTRQRDLSPSIDDQHIFTRQHPADAQEYTIEVPSAADNALDLAVFSK